MMMKKMMMMMMIKVEVLGLKGLMAWVQMMSLQ